MPRPTLKLPRKEAPTQQAKPPTSRALRAHQQRDRAVAGRRQRRSNRIVDAGASSPSRVRAREAMTLGASRNPDHRRGESAAVEAHERARPLLAARSRRVDRERLGQGRRRRDEHARHARAAFRPHRDRPGRAQASGRARDDPPQQADRLRVGPGRGRLPAGERADPSGKSLGRRPRADHVQAEPPARPRTRGQARHRFHRASSSSPRTAASRAG